MVGEIVDADRFEGEPVAPVEEREEPANSASAERGGAWLTNEIDSVNAATDPETEVEDDRQLPTPREVAERFWEEYPELARMPLSRQHKCNLRPELLEEDTSEQFVEPILPNAPDGANLASMDDLPEDAYTGFNVVQQDGKNPVMWGEAVTRLLFSHEDTRNTTLHMARGRPGDPDHATHDVQADNRWMASYQKKKFAEMNGWFREVVGVGERPSGESPAGLMENPNVVLITRSASSCPDGYKLSPVDFDDELADGWTPMYNKIRNDFRARGIDWQYDRRTEPHPGDGENVGYPHEHMVLLVDSPDLSLSDFRPFVEEHVKHCDAAGPVAHDLHIDDWDANREDVGTVEIREPDEIDNLAAYVCDYASIEPDDLLERSTEYVAFAAAMWAKSAQTISRSDAATWASKADACKQRFEHGDCGQELDHAEEVCRIEIRGNPVIACQECETPHGIDQSQTLAEAKYGTSDDGPTAVADGGIERTADREDDLRERWESVRSAASSGESPTRTRKEILEPGEFTYDCSIRRRDIRYLLLSIGMGAEVPEFVADPGGDAPDKGCILDTDPRIHPVEPGSYTYVADARAPDFDDPLPEIVVWINRRHHASPSVIEEVLQEVRAGYDPLDEPISFERAPKWRLDAVTVHDETHSVNDGGGGVELEESKLSGEALKEWIRRNTRICELAADTRKQLLWKGARYRLSEVIDKLAQRAGPSIERCEHLIEAFVEIPESPLPWWEPACWECGGTYEGNHAEREWVCWNCGDTYPMR